MSMSILQAIDIMIVHDHVDTFEVFNDVILLDKYPWTKSLSLNEKKTTD